MDKGSGGHSRGGSPIKGFVAHGVLPNGASQVAGVVDGSLGSRRSRRPTRLGSICGPACALQWPPAICRRATRNAYVVRPSQLVCDETQNCHPTLLSVSWPTIRQDLLIPTPQWPREAVYDTKPGSVSAQERSGPRSSVARGSGRIRRVPMLGVLQTSDRTHAHTTVADPPVRPQRQLELIR